MLWLLSMALATTPTATVTEPISSDAQIDKNALRLRRPFELGALVTPIAFALGRYSHISYYRRVGDSNNGAGLAGQWAVGSALVVGGSVPVLLMGEAEVSRRALERQGLKPKRIRMWIPTVLSITASLASTAGWQLQLREKPGAHLSTGVGIAAYAAAVALPALQLEFNTQARRKAGWWSSKARR